MSSKRKQGKKKKKYKLKTHKATSKRFRITGSGKIMRTKGRQGHFRRRKSKRAKRQYKWMQEVKGVSYKQSIKRLAPYLKR